MSVLNQASDGQFNILIALVRASIRFGPRTRADLLALCGFDLTTVENSRLNATFLRWSELGLFEAPEGQIVIAEPYKSRLGKDVAQAEARLPTVLREIVLREDNNLRFWEAEANKSADLTRGMAWMLAQNVYTLDTSNTASVQRLEASQLDPTQSVIQNDTRYNALKAWMVYLGFGREGALFTVDPTVALRWALDDLFEGDTPVSARTFLDKSCELIPVLDGGAYRRRVEAILKESAWAATPDGRLSTSFSRAIERLVHSGELAIQQRADAEGGLELTGFNGRDWRAFTHIWRPKARGGAK